jgi:hypothetical protein
MTEKPRDFGLSGVTDKLKHFPSESEAVIHNKDNLNTGLTEKGKSDTVELVAVSLDKDNLNTGLTEKGKSNTVELVAVSLDKDNLNTGLTEKGKSDTIEPVAVSLDKDESEDMFDFRREALAKLDNPNVKVLQHAVETAKKKPRIGVYSPIVSAATEYLRETVPKYSASDEARKILEEEYEKRYPELVQRIKSRMNKGS